MQFQRAKCLTAGAALAIGVWASLPAYGADWTIENIRPGMPVKDAVAALKKSRNTVETRDVRGMLTKEGIATPILFFGVAGTFIGNDGSRDDTLIISDLSSPGKVAAVTRHLVFPDEQTPPLATLVASLQAKFGAPSKAMEPGSLERMYVWDDGRGRDVRTKRGLDACRNFTAMFQNMLTNINMWSDPYNQRQKECGLFVVADISVGGRGEATEVRYQLVDYDALRAAYDSTDRMFKAGQAEADKKRSSVKVPNL